MSKREITSLCRLYAISPIHAGSGSSTSTIDLPIQRERHTNWPHIQSTGVKGAMRAHFRHFGSQERRKDLKVINLIFGSDEQDDWSPSRFKDSFDNQANLPGTASFSDAKLLAFPMRSDTSPFIWITCPAVLERLNADLVFAGHTKADLSKLKPSNDEKAIGLGSNIKNKVVLEDAVVEVEKDQSLPIGPIKDLLGELSDRLLVVHDSLFSYAVESCTEVQPQIKISEKTGATADGSLRYQELLPADSLLYTMVYFSAAHFDTDLKARAIHDFLTQGVKGFLQIGGDMTLGRGICRITWIPGKED